MTLRSCSVLAAAVGLWLTHPAVGPGAAHAQPQGQEPARLGVQSGQALPPDVSTNQQLADRIAGHLRQSGELRGYRIEIAADKGLVELSGQVGDASQREKALRLIQAVPGVAVVRDRLSVAPPTPVTPAAAVTQPAPLQEPGKLGAKEVPGAPGVGGGPPPEPTPIFAAPPGLPYASMNPPPLPPYAWPTFAPYNNYSRVAYPTQYPPQAWPYIGPMYPFPKVPLGWRSISLSYYDGHWWYGKRATGHDWWRIRYW